MAGRKPDTKHTQEARDRIQLTQIIKRLQWFALGEQDDQGIKVEMSPAQVKAAHILINKRMPDLTAADINITHEMPANKEEMFKKISDRIGGDLAKQLFPQFAPMEDRVLN